MSAVSLIAIGASLLLLILRWRFPKDYGRLTCPWVGIQSNGSALGKLKASVLSLGKRRTLLTQANEKFLRHGRACTIPVFPFGSITVIPPTQLQWLVNQPASILNVRQYLDESLFAKYVMPHRFSAVQDFHEEIIWSDLSRALEERKDEMIDEMREQLQKFCASKIWKEVSVFDIVLKTLAASTNHLIIAEEFDREDYLTAVTQYIRCAAATIGILKLCPKPLLHILAPVVSLPTRYFSWNCKIYLRPLVTKRLADIRRNRLECSSVLKLPDDFLAWLIRGAEERRNSVECQPDFLAERLVMINFATMLTTSLISFGTLVAIAECEAPVRDQLRYEIGQAYEKNGNCLDKSALQDLQHLDSTIREAMRTKVFTTMALGRKVVAEEGVRLDDGSFLPKGTNIVIPQDTLHHDSAAYEEPLSFKPFRYSTSLSSTTDECGSGDGSAQRRNDQATMRNDMSPIKTGPNYIAFGYGKHSCPGRFLAAYEVKALIACMLWYFDFEIVHSGAPTLGGDDFQVASIDSTINVRSRSLIGPDLK